MKSKIKLLFFFFLMYSCFGFSQNKQKDSLLLLLKNTRQDTARCRILTTLIDNEYNDDVWSTYNEEIIKIAQSNLKNVITPRNRLDTLYFSTLANAIGSRGLIFHGKGDFKKAFECYNQALEIEKKTNNKSNIGSLYNNIAGIYMDQNIYDNALEFFKKSLLIRLQINDEDGAAQCYTNIATLYDRKKDLTNAVHYFFKALEIEKKKNDLGRIGLIYNNMGSMYCERNENEKGLDYLKKSLEIQKKMNNKKGICYALANIAEVLIKQKKYTEARPYLLRALELAKELKSPINMRAPTLSLFQLESKLKNWEKALTYYKLFIAARDSVFSIENTKTSIKEQVKFDYEKQKAVDQAVHEQELIVSAEREQKQRVISIAIAVGLILMITFAVFVFIRLRISNNQNKIIEKQKKLVEEKNHQVEEKQKEIIDSITYAKRIQNTLLAHEEYLDEHLPDHFVFFKPKDIVSGDFYWATKKDNCFYLAVCDSTGHGVPGAFMSLLNTSFLNEAINEKNIEKPNEILDHVRKRLIENISKDGGQDGMDAILICIEGNSITYAAANNSPIIIGNNSYRSLEADKMPVGKGERMEPFTLRKIDMQKGDSLYLYTDGYADQFGGMKGKKFKYKQLNELLVSISAKSFIEQKETLYTAFTEWKGALEQVDDVCIIGIKI